MLEIHTVNSFYALPHVHTHARTRMHARARARTRRRVVAHTRMHALSMIWAMVWELVAASLKSGWGYQTRRMRDDDGPYGLVIVRIGKTN